MRFDYYIYKKKFPTFLGAYIALWGYCFFATLIIIAILVLILGNDPLKDCCYVNKCVEVSVSVIYYAFDLGFLIFAIYTYITVNKNKGLD